MSRNSKFHNPEGVYFIVKFHKVVYENLIYYKYIASSNLGFYF
jgi:hypothetical protein